MAAIPSSASDRGSTLAPWHATACAIAAVGLAGLSLVAGTWPGLYGPAVHGDAAIVFLHVPAAWLSLLLFAAAAGCAATTLSVPDRTPGMLLHAIAPAGLAAAVLALVTGLASQRVSGVSWGWDARLICELVLLLLFAGVLALHSAIDEPGRADRAVAVLVLIGALNVPSLYLSVNWWHTLHEQAALGVGSSPPAVAAMALMTLSFCFAALAFVLARLQAFERERAAFARIFAMVRGEGGSVLAGRAEEQR